MTPIFGNNTKNLKSSVQSHNNVIRDETYVIAPHMRNQKNYIFDFIQLCLFSVANTFIVFAVKYP